jgi:hypothetical protein
VKLFDIVAPAINTRQVLQRDPRPTERVSCPGSLDRENPIP